MAHIITSCFKFFFGERRPPRLEGGRSRQPRQGLVRGLRVAGPLLGGCRYSAVMELGPENYRVWALIP